MGENDGRTTIYDTINRDLADTVQYLRRSLIGLAERGDTLSEVEQKGEHLLAVSKRYERRTREVAEEEMGCCRARWSTMSGACERWLWRPLCSASAALWQCAGETWMIALGQESIEMLDSPLVIE